MFRLNGRLRLFLAAGVLSLLLGAPAVPQQGRSPRVPDIVNGVRLEPIAETRLLMEGIAQPNFRGLERLLAQKPATVEAWTYARGQALLIAEGGNLLMMRPPHNKGENSWMDRALDMRTAAGSLARVLANRDYETSRDRLVELAGTCSRCHQTFRVPVRIVAFAEPPNPDQPARPPNQK